MSVECECESSVEISQMLMEDEMVGCPGYTQALYTNGKPITPPK